MPRPAVSTGTCRATPTSKVWFFNPMAWQVVFYSGAVLAVVAHRLAILDRWWRPRPASPSLYLAFAAFIALSWHYNSLERLIPDWIARQIYPIDKTNLDILRFVHFLAMAWLVRLAVRPNARFPQMADFASRFAGAESIPCRYSVSVRFLLSLPRSSSPVTKIPPCRSSSSVLPVSPSCPSQPMQRAGSRLNREAPSHEPLGLRRFLRSDRLVVRRCGG